MIRSGVPCVESPAVCRMNVSRRTPPEFIAGYAPAHLATNGADESVDWFAERSVLDGRRPVTMMKWLLATLAGKKPNIDRVGLSTCCWARRGMYTSLISSADVATPLWVIPVAKGSDGIRAVPAKKRLPIIEPWSSPASFHEVRRGRALEGQFVADVADDALFQRVREVNARIAACDLRNLRYEYANSIARASGSPPRTMSVTTPTRTPCVRSAGVATAGTFPRARSGSMAPRGENFCHPSTMPPEKCGRSWNVAVSMSICRYGVDP